MSERNVVAEHRQLRRSALWPDRGAPDGSNRSVLLIGGFGFTPRALEPLARWLAGAGWVVRTADLGWNVGCGTRAVETVLEALTDMTESAPQHVPVAIGGHSRGGVLGRVAAVRAPDLVERLITVCTPWALGPPDRPGVAAVTKAIKGARRHGLDVLGSVDCADGPCCAVFRQQMSVRPRCPWTAIRSTADGIAGDQARVEGPDREIVTSTTHLGAILSVAGWQAIAEALR